MNMKKLIRLSCPGRSRGQACVEKWHIATISLYSLPERVNTQTFLYTLFLEVIFNLILKLFIEKDSKNTFRYYFKCTHKVIFFGICVMNIEMEQLFLFEFIVSIHTEVSAVTTELVLTSEFLPLTPMALTIPILVCSSHAVFFKPFRLGRLPTFLISLALTSVTLELHYCQIILSPSFGMGILLHGYHGYLG